MENYVIGLFDDEESELKSIRRTIKKNAPEGIKYDFKNYSISENPDNIIKEILSQISSDIENKIISCLIIDSKIMIATKKIQGTEIFKQIKENIPLFPMIILTQIPKESITPDYVDADKVYDKHFFFRLEEKYAKEKVSNIFDSMRKYVMQRDKLLLDIQKLSSDYSKGDNSAIAKILSKEEKLNSFFPTGITLFDKIFNEERISNIIGLIDNAKKVLGEKDETSI